MRPPLTSRRWNGVAPRTRREAHRHPFLLRWPWEILLFTTPSALLAPEMTAVLPARRRPLTREITFPPRRRRDGGMVWEIPCEGRSSRGAADICVAFDAALPPGVDVALEMRPEGSRGPFLLETRLRRGLAAGQALRFPPGQAGDLLLQPGPLQPLLLTLTHGRMETPPRPRLALGRPPAAGRILSPRIGEELAADDPLPELLVRPSAGANRLHVTIRPQGIASGDFPGTTFPVRAEARESVRRDGMELVRIDLMRVLHLSPPAFRELVARLDRRHPDLDGFWLWIGLLETRGDPPLVQARAREVPIKIFYRRRSDP